MKTISLSSCESEFNGFSEVSREIMWICNFLDEIGVSYHTPEIYTDSNSAMNWAQDPIQHQRNKHVEIKYYYVRDVVASGKVRMFRIHTTLNIADILTKPVGGQILDRLGPRLMGHEPVINPRH